MEKTMIKACVFDLDGTLLDTLESIRHFVNVNMRKNGLSEITLEATCAYVGDGANKLIARAISNSGVDVATEAGSALLAKILPEYVKDYDLDPAYKTKPYDGIPEAVALLRSRGLRLGVLSNKPDATVKQLAEQFFPGVFDAVMGGTDGIPLKPAPDGAFAICRALGAEPCEVAYFGDTAVDIKTAKAFGAALNVAVAWGFRTKDELERDEPDVILASPCQIPEIIYERQNSTL